VDITPPKVRCVESCGTEGTCRGWHSEEWSLRTFTPYTKRPFRGLTSGIRRIVARSVRVSKPAALDGQTASRTETPGGCPADASDVGYATQAIGKGNILRPVTTLSRNGWLAIVALLMELGALIVLLVPEERTSQGASVWSWYWPLANTLYFVGFIAAAIAIAWAVVSLAASLSTGGNRSRSLIAFGLGVLAIVVNRLVPYH
jgi:hypothetical protein